MQPDPVPKAPSSKRAIPWNSENQTSDLDLRTQNYGLYIIKVHIAESLTCQPIPRLSTDGGLGVALPYLEAAKNVPVDCSIKEGKRFILLESQYKLSFLMI